MQGTRFECTFNGKKSIVSPVGLKILNYTKDIMGFLPLYLTWIESTKDTYGFTLKYYEFLLEITHPQT